MTGFAAECCIAFCDWQHLEHGACSEALLKDVDFL